MMGAVFKLSAENLKWLADVWEVLALFIIPIGGGIPAGVILAKNKGLPWPTMTALYLISDVILACLFEPTLLLIVWLAKRSEFLTRWMAAVKEAMNKSIANYTLNPGPFSLILISFGVDPMTGRTAAMAAGHSFVSGWALAIVGDMFFFGLLMISTLWLNQFLGDGTWTVVIITVVMLVLPGWIRRLRGPAKPRI